MTRNTRGDQLILLVILLIGLGGVLYVQFPQLGEWVGVPEPEVVRVHPVHPAHPESRGQVVAEAEQQQGKPVEEVHESPDSETTLEHFIPRSSIGHSQGLQKVADPLKLDSSAAIVVDAKNNQMLFGKNPDSELPMASITKLMTGLVIVEAKLSLEDPITITEDDIDHERNSRSRMRVGTMLTRSEALHLALMSSENRAAHALGRTYPGGLPAFVEAMNRKAKQLGMTHTRYVDPTGLSEKNHSTARDLATLVLAASAYPMLREYSTTPERQVAFGNRVLRYRNSDPLIKDAAWDIELQKTGYIIEAGHCVVLRTKVEARDVVMVVLDAGTNGARSRDARRMRQWVAFGADENAYKLAMSTPMPRAVKPAAKADPQPPKKATGKKTVAKGKEKDQADDTKQVKVVTKKKDGRVKAEFQAHRKSKKDSDNS